MKTKMTFKTSYRVTFGSTRTHIGWVNSGVDLDLGKLVKGVTADNSSSVEALLLGTIENIDAANPVTSFHIVGAEENGNTPFLGYLETTQLAKAETLLKLWPQMQFSAVVK